MKTEKWPRTMDNQFSDNTKCDNCGASFRALLLIWVWHEHTCCSKACAIKAKEKGDENETNLL